MSDSDSDNEQTSSGGQRRRRRGVRIGFKPKTKIQRAGLVTDNVLNMIDTFDRPGDASAEWFFADAGNYAAGLSNKPNQRVPKAGAYAGVGIGRAHAEWSVFEATAKGPNASAMADASGGTAKAFLKAELASASGTAGPLHAKVGLSAETGGSIGLTGAEIKILGTGASIGAKTGVSVFGNELAVECSVM